ncbi:hypothetical protein EUA93_16380 [Nocardioides oleivorans]|uniref:Aminopeptidase N n=1 Tax=Nocardioides oleivorans TaxID=273676 RepID=A0A4Q2RV18_9ACTN|nr:M1 family metallopeptidase [Nocardioides oleivorans]RYB91725.1 hypothetical protein EUA93_16380 [Nocardioides oleivorans]
MRDLKDGPTWWRKAASRAVPLVLVAGGAAVMSGAPTYAADPVDGAQTAGDPMFPHVGNGGYDALHYDVDIAWDATGVVSGYMTGAFSSASTTMRAKTTGLPLRTFSLDLEGLTVDSVSVNGTAATWERITDAVSTTHKLVVTPAVPVEGEFTTVITYHGAPQHHVDADGSWEGWTATVDGATFMGQPIGSMTGYPNNNTPGDKATYSFDLDVPTSITSATGTGPAAAVSNGELASRVPSADGTRATWRWVQGKPMASELALISIGKYDVIESQVTLASGRTIPEWTFIDSALSAANKTTITNRRAQLGTFLSRLESIYGPYPGNSTGVVVDTVPIDINYALETQDRSFFPSTSSVNGNTLIHELAHQWYGDNVSPELWTDIWINEGMATWGPAWHTQVLAPATPNPAAVETTYFNSWNNTAAASASWTTPPGAQTDPANLYGYQTYTRGAQFWEALRTAIRDDAFFEVVKAWQTRHGGESRSGDDLKALAEEISGRDLDAFWQDWILDGDKPAWPAKWNAGMSSTTTDGVVAPGATLDYTLTAANVGKVPLEGKQVTVDLADVLDDATLGTLPAELSLNGTTLTWAVPTTPVASSAPSASFSVTVAADASSDTLDAVATAVGLGTACAACTTAHGVDIQPVAPAPDPTISGTVAVGSSLAAVSDGWPTGTTFTYQWQVAGEPVAGAVGATYVPEVVDLGKEVTVSVTGARTDYSSVTRTSAPARVGEGTLTASIPAVSGPAVFGQVLTGSPGTWGAGATLGYQWLRDGTPVAGANASSYQLGLADLGSRLTLAVTGTSPGYASMTVTSTATEPVVRATLARSRVVIAGKARVGRTLKARTPGLEGGVTVDYTWYAGTKKIGRKATAKLGRGTVGTKVTVEVTITKDGYVTRSATSRPTTKVKKQKK